MGNTVAKVVENFLTGAFETPSKNRNRFYDGTFCSDTGNLYTKEQKNGKRTLFSYNTLIAIYDIEKNIVFLTDTGLTPTTSKHRLELLTALNDKGIKGYQIPVKMNEYNIPTFEMLIKRFEARMDSLSMGTDLALADNRRKFKDNYYMYKELMGVTGLTSSDVDKYTDIMAKMEDTDFVKQLQRERRSFMTNKSKMYADTIRDKRYF